MDTVVQTPVVDIVHGVAEQIAEVCKRRGYDAVACNLADIADHQGSRVMITVAWPWNDPNVYLKVWVLLHGRYRYTCTTAMTFRSGEDVPQVHVSMNADNMHDNNHIQVTEYCDVSGCVMQALAETSGFAVWS